MRRAQASIGLFLVLSVALSAALLSGCGAGEIQGTAGVAQITVSERDFHIKAPSRISAGNVDLSVRNMGPDAHELILVRGTQESLPERSDGLTIDEDAVEDREAGALEPGNPGADRNLPVDLKPGHYVMFCNMYGHFQAGMHTDLVVQ